MRALYLTIRRWGWDPRKTLVALRGTRRFHRDARQFRKQQKHLGGADPFPRGPKYPVYGEWNSVGGTASGAYFHQDLFVAREVFRRSPRRHIDVGSRVDGLVAHLASFREVDVIDVRPTTARKPGIHFIQHDMMQATLLPGEQPDSLSCLHTLEHFGLGRYGDPISVMGWRDGL